MNSRDFGKTILVTGANGQLGKEVRQIAVDFPAYNFLFTTRQDLPIDDAQALRNIFDQQQIHYCINCAAYTAVDKAEEEKDQAFLINADAVGALASICSDHRTKLIHISTDYVYDGSRHEPLKEEDAVAPLNIYGWSKLKGEELILNHYPSALIIRTSWVYSSFGNNFVKTIWRLCREKERLNVINDQFGSPTYAADLAGIIMKFVEAYENTEDFSGIVNYCNSGTISWFEFAIAIKSLINSPCEILPIPSSEYKTAATRPSYSILDTSKIRKMLNTDIPLWNTSLEKCLDLLSA